MPKTVYNHHFAHSFCHLQRRESTTSPPVNILSENSCWLPIEPVRLPAELWDYNRRQQRNCSWGIIFSDSKQHIPWYPQSDFIIWLNDCHICILLTSRQSAQELPNLRSAHFGNTKWAQSLMNRRFSQLVSGLFVNPLRSSSEKRASKLTTTPLPITFRQLLDAIPDGSKWKSE